MSESEAKHTARRRAAGNDGRAAWWRPSHCLASAAGLGILQERGSAADALIAANATLCRPTPTCPASEAISLPKRGTPARGQVMALNGFQPLRRAGHHRRLPRPEMGRDQPRRPLAANTVPGVVSAWWELHQRHGKLDWQRLFEPAIRYAEEGFPISPKFRDYITEYADTLRQYDTTAAIYLPGGHAPRAGSMFRQGDLAQSLRQVAGNGVDGFYRGELAQRIVRGLQQAGGLLTEDDLPPHVGLGGAPAHHVQGLRGDQLPPTQGIAALMILNLLAEHGLEGIAERARRTITT